MMRLKRRMVMELKFRVAARIAKPVHEVFEAVADPAKLSHYFTTGGAKGRLETGATVTWDFADFPGAFPVWVIEVVEAGKIVSEWQASEGEPHKAEGGERKDSGYPTRHGSAQCGKRVGKNGYFSVGAVRK